jgi:glycosyltransferase involved in cell wall biosynthesis
LDPALCFIRAMSRRVELHVLLELSPEAWQSSILDMSPMDLPGLILPANSMLRDCFPASVEAYWQNAASFNVIVHKCPRGIHPAAWWVSHRTVKFIRNLRPDLIHLDDVSLRLAWALPEIKNTPIVLSIHDPEPHTGEGNWRVNLARWLTFGRVKRYILHNHALKESFCLSFKLKRDIVDVIPLGVYMVFREWATSGVAQDGRTVLFFGRISPYKGIEVLYRAAPLVAEQIQNVRFIVAGRPLRGYQLPVSPILSNGGQIEVISEYIPNSLLAKLFQRATVVVCPYTDATQSGVVLTAFAFERPVIASRVGGLPEYVEDGVTGWLMPPGDAKDLAEAIVQSLTNKNLQGQIISGIARACAERLDWDTIADQTLQTYSRALDV